MDKNNRILVVDDQQDLREQLAKLLSRPGGKNETTSLVEQMRARLLGAKGGETEVAKDEEELAEEDGGYVVDVVGQGQDAFEMVKAKNADGKPYALMFLDMRMPPGWDGLETAKRIREIDKSIEIVIMTAYADHDQRKIAEIVGTPEKMLYIKKPFQAEEIFQLALSLTTKWTVEQREKTRREWLETLIRCMSRVKSVATIDQSELYGNALKAIFSFTGSSEGFMVVKNQKTQTWELVAESKVVKATVESFIAANQQRLDDSITTQNVDGKCFLPLKREGFAGVIIICDMVRQDDPEWYKLLSLLVMTTSEVLSNASLMRALLEKNGQATS